MRVSNSLIGGKVLVGKFGASVFDVMQPPRFHGFSTRHSHPPGCCSREHDPHPSLPAPWALGAYFLCPSPSWPSHALIFLLFSVFVVYLCNFQHPFRYIHRALSTNFENLLPLQVWDGQIYHDHGRRLRDPSTPRFPRMHALDCRCAMRLVVVHRFCVRCFRSFHGRGAGMLLLHSEVLWGLGLCVGASLQG